MPRSFVSRVAQISRQRRVAEQAAPEPRPSREERFTRRIDRVRERLTEDRQRVAGPPAR